jgi:hypothetical protein
MRCVAREIALGWNYSGSNEHFQRQSAKKAKETAHRAPAGEAAPENGQEHPKATAKWKAIWLVHSEPDERYIAASALDALCRPIEPPRTGS